MNKDIHKMLKSARDQGFRIKEGKHVSVYPSEGPPVVISKTTKTPATIHEIKSNLRKIGVKV